MGEVDLRDWLCLWNIVDFERGGEGQSLGQGNANERGSEEKVGETHYGDYRYEEVRS